MSQRPVVNPNPMPHIRTVPTGNALEWIRIGVMLFKSYPLMWGVLFVLYYVIMNLLLILGQVGTVFGAMIAPVFAGGFMLGAQAIERKQDLEINHLFAGFKSNASPLVKLGFVYVLVLFLFGIVLTYNIDPTILEAMPKNEPLTPAQMQSLSKPLMLLGLLGTPIIMAFWFAPALVALDQMHPWHALKMSFIACLKNMLPLLFYSFLIGLFFILLTAVAQVFGPFLQYFLLLVLIFFLLPLMMTSLYISYRDIFITAD